jgi:protocatechuate 3,4-dioxygenase beta subunit
VLGVALAGFCPLVVMQLRMTRKLQAGFDPATTHDLVPSSGTYAFDGSGNVVGFALGNTATDRWARKFGAMAAFRSSASLTGYVYLDLNDDGVKQPVEPGISGVTVTLTFSDAQGQSHSLAAQTASTGAYLFTNLAPGFYTITATQPSGYADGQDTIGSQGGTAGDDVLSNILLGSGTVGTGNNFGEVGASLAGFVYVDINDDGVKQETEPGLANVPVTLTGTDQQGGNVSQSLVTNAVGAYRFSSLRPGTYAITETQPSGYSDGVDTAGTQGGTVGDDELSSIALGGGDQGAGYNFGEHVTDLSLGSLAGFVYVDKNGNGTKDLNESGIAGAVLTLTGNDDRGGTVNLVTSTDPSGGYSFTNLLPGTYAIAETTPSGYTDGVDTLGTQGGTAGDDLFVNLPVSAGVNGINNNFVEQAIGTSTSSTSSSLAGYVYIDGNANGVRDDNEPGVAGVTLTLSGASSAVATTGSTGYYVFANLTNGTYKITETQPVGYADGLDSTGTAAGTAQDDQIVNISLGSGFSGTGYNFGEHMTDTSLSSLSGAVYVDQNGNGVKDSGEPGVAGITLTLTGNDARGFSITETTVTAAEGSYLFPVLSPGTYAIAETAPTSYLDGQDTAGSQGATVNYNLLSDISLDTGINGTGNNFGERQYQVSILSVSKDTSAPTLSVQVEVTP